MQLIFRNTIAFGGLLVGLLLGSHAAAQSYTDGASGAGIAVSGSKNGGVGFGDLNNDGCLDHVVNTNTLGRVFFQNRAGGSCAGTFTDVTATNAAGMLTRSRPRSVVLADLNQDGALDIVVNTWRNLDIYISSGAATFTFGNASQDPSQTFTTWPNGGTSLINSEGIVAADFDGDGDMDIAVESHGYGIRLLRQTGLGTGVFEDVLPAVSGLPTTGSNGDYAAAGDLDQDGLVDFVMRRHGSAGLASADLFFNQGAASPRFASSTQIAEVSNNSRKGAISICDFNNDGRLDVFWSPNVMYFQDPTTFRVFSRSTTWTSDAISVDNILGSTCFDADNDGDMDLFLTGSGSRRQLFINDGTGSFSVDNRGIAGSGEALGAVGVDYDRDGDLDISVNASGANELWRQTAAPTLQSEYLVVWPQHVNGDGSRRPANGATVRRESCGGIGFGARVQLDSGSGRGTTVAGPVHLGLGRGGAASTFIVAVSFPNGRTIRVAVNPSSLGRYQEIVVDHNDADDLSLCPDQDLDGVPDASDPDDDNDGILDIDELGGADLSVDGNGNGIPDYQDASVVSCLDAAPADGICDALPPSVDADGDGVPNHFDLDADNDGIFDTVESGSGLDANFDGIPDALIDTDGDGLIDDADAGPTDPSNLMGTITPTTTDGDALADFLDRDSDDDGLTDAREGGGGLDADGDGVPDTCGSVNTSGICADGTISAAPVNTDASTIGGDTVPDYLDNDSDADGLLDRIEAYDTDGDEMVTGTEIAPSGNDQDDDGIDDAFDPDCAAVGVPAGCAVGGAPVTDPLAAFRDADSDRTPDWLQVCGDAYVTGAEPCDSGGASATCTAMCLLELGEPCLMSGVCDSMLCSASSMTCVVCDDTTTGGVDAGCTAGAPACVGSGASASCEVCDDDQPGAAMDDGCSGGTPLCNPTTNTCTTCVDLGVGVLDLGCSGTTPVCDPTGTGSCGACEDNDPGTGSGDVDFGCGGAGEGPFCSGSGGAAVCVDCLGAAHCDDSNDCTDDVCVAGSCTNPDLTIGETCGTTDACDGMGMCVECVNDDAAGRDSGCEAAAPFCDGVAGMAGTCVECLTRSDCSGAEFCNPSGACVPGCSMDADCAGSDVCDPGAMVCVTCLDSMTGAGLDSGCSAATPVCDGATGSGTPGTRCVECTDTSHCTTGVCEVTAGMCEVCIDDATGPATDSGCVAPTPICDSAVPECVECVTDADCAGLQTCGPTQMCEFPDTDRDGLPDDIDIDDDNDGIVDSVETGGLDLSLDSDGDGIPDYADPDAVTCDDADANGSCDELPITVDLDRDGVPNHADLDADGDGVPDSTEGHDADMDGVADTTVPSVFLDADMDGLADEYDVDSGGVMAATQDTDGDSRPDFLDGDSDDDGIPDHREAYDADFNGVQDVLRSGLDADGDGLDDAFDVDQGGVAPPAQDFDTDGRPDYLDMDSDADGIADSLECGDPTVCSDVDGDGAPDYLDLDSDDDTIVDAIEGHDADMDGVADRVASGVDANRDGLDDAFDPDSGGTAPPLQDTDADGTPDWRDPEDDGDGVLTAGECPVPASCPDGDADGTPDYLDPDDMPSDMDMDGIPDDVECMGSPATCMDSDGDGTPDHQDPDDDGDGVPTRVECAFGPTVCDVDRDGRPNHLDIDSDDDGILDMSECMGAECVDTDSDGTPDYWDLDTDADGIADAVEGHDMDMDGVPDRAALGMDADGDGLDDAYDPDASGTPAPLQDTDGDGVSDWRDADDDGDGFGTALECRDPAVCPDEDVDGRPDYLDVDSAPLDTDMDGIPDAFECPPPFDPVGDPASCPDSDGDGRPDFDDDDDDDDGIPTREESYDGDGDPTDDDTDGDGIPDYLDRDDDNDGIPTSTECASFGAGCSDMDGDGTPDYLDVCGDGSVSAWDDVTAWEECDDGNTTSGDGCDATCRFEAGEGDRDMDGFLDSFECPAPASPSDPASCPDTDGDGAPDFDDPDDDGDGVLTRDELGPGGNAMPRDSDMDGMLDYLDPDDDNDTIPTADELGPDGAADPRDTDGDGMLDYLDPDDDDDGIPTATEVADGNGLTPPDEDVDEDGLENWRDPDADGDTIPDGDEAGDDDDNGVPDYLEANGAPRLGGLAGGALCAMRAGSTPSPLLPIFGLGLAVLVFALRRRR